MASFTDAFSRSFLSNSRQGLNLDHQADDAKENDAGNQTLKRVTQSEEHATPLAHRGQVVAVNQSIPGTTDPLTENSSLDMWLNFELNEINYIEGSGTIPVTKEPELPYDPELWDSWLDWAAGDPPREFRIARDDYIYTFESMLHDQDSSDGNVFGQSTLRLTPEAANENNVQTTTEGPENYDGTDLYRTQFSVGDRLPSKHQQPSGHSSPLLAPNLTNVRTITRFNPYSKYPLGTVDNNAWPAPQGSVQVSDEQLKCIEGSLKDSHQLKSRFSQEAATIPSSTVVDGESIRPSPGTSRQTSVVTDLGQPIPSTHIVPSNPVPSQNHKRKRTDDSATPLSKPNQSPPRKSRGRAPHTNLPTNTLSIPVSTTSLLLPTRLTIPANDQRRNPPFSRHTREIYQCVYRGPAVGQGGCGVLVSPVSPENLNNHLVIHARMEESMVLAGLLDVNNVHALLWAKKVPFRCSVTGCGFYTDAWELDGVKERHEVDAHSELFSDAMHG